jgi:hypothetical protein
MSFATGSEELIGQFARVTATEGHLWSFMGSGRAGSRRLRFLCCKSRKLRVEEKEFSFVSESVRIEQVKA